MTSKSSFWKLSSWNFKKRLWTFALCAVIWFFILPVSVFMKAGSMIQGYDAKSLQENLGWIRYMIINSNISGGGFYSIVAIGMGMLLALQGFSWINHQNKVDMFKSVPVKSSTRFWYINLNSLLIFLFSFGVNMILANVAAGIRGIWNWSFMEASVLSFCLHLFLFMSSYLLVNIAQSLTGNIVLGFCGGSVLLLIEPLCYALRNELMATYYDTYVGEMGYEYFGKGFLSPICAYVGMYKSVSVRGLGFADSGNFDRIWKFVLIFLVQIVIYGIISYILYQKRPAQTGGKNMVFPKTKPVIKCMIMIMGSLYLGVFMARFDYVQALWYGLFGTVCGLLILQVLLQSIIEGDFKEAVHGKISFGISAVTAVVLFFVFALDMTGYDTYVPKADQVKDFAFVREGDYYYDYFDEDGNYIASTEYLMNHMKITDENVKEQVLDMLKEAIESDEYYYKASDEKIAARSEITAAAVSTGESIYEDGGQHQEIYVKFRLSDGKEVVRRYYLKKDAVRNCFADLYELAEYKTALYMILNESAKEEYFNNESTPRVSYGTYTTGISDCNSSSREVVQKLFDAVKEDLEARSSQTVISGPPTGILHFTQHYSMGYYTGIGRNSISFHIPVYEDDAAVMALVKEMGWYQEPGIREDDVVKVIVYQVVDEGENRKVLEIEPGDPLFGAVVGDLILNDAVNYTDAGAFTKLNYWAEVITNGSGEGGDYNYRYSCLLETSKFPEDLERAFEKVEVEEKEQVY